ncbi:aspartoacylase [Cylindrospermopsis raciborskii]|uniref:Probable aspartoacylase n=1 Tax=Cylindrospermopsis raciborskii CENA302 TaxID=1170768 RepID=A0A9Q5QUR3_9CYAN|nr:aspartoacylase [Cylindrospermopsis raciborskii]OPH08763.1 aspartoacylase [Cylindrospermopsis raciborskii CENA302]
MLAYQAINSEISRVIIAGGIHGNELIGVYLVKTFEKYGNLIKRESFETICLLGNTPAINAGRRYVDKDLNRCFTKDILLNANTSIYEESRAREIWQLLQPHHPQKLDAIIDIHTTTANMGLCIIISNMNPVLITLGSHLISISPLIKVCFRPPTPDGGFLRSLSELGFTLEVGPVPQGILNAQLFQQTAKIIYAILDFFENYNQGKISINQKSNGKKLNVYEFMSTVDYPRNESGDLQGMIHPQLEYKDYQPLNFGDAIFLTFDNQEIFYQGKSTVYPVFINEAAYYEKGIAMHLTQKKLVHI